MNPVKLFFGALCVGLVVVISLLTGYHRTQVVQRGYRGTAMNELFSDNTLRTEEAINKLPKPLPLAKATGPTAAETYDNVQVLGDLHKPQFARIMLSIKSWVAPEVGCNYCHAAPVYNSDEKYTKRVAREMIRMVRHINTDWTQHVGKTGVTCYTCHRGQPVPARLWYSAPPKQQAGYLWRKSDQRLPTAAAGSTALPNDALTDYLLHDDQIRVVGTTALRENNRNSVVHAKDTYSLMMVMAESLGVNCTFCHNTKSFASWNLSTPQRVTAWYGIRMVRDLNNTVMLPLKGTLPPERLGPTGDVPKIYCATCHQGANKPLYGAPMLKLYPELIRPAPSDAAPPGDDYGTTPGAAPGPAPVAPAPAAPSTNKTAHSDAEPPPAKAHLSNASSVHSAAAAADGA